MVVFIAIGAAFVAFGLFSLIRTRQFLQRAVTVEGTVVDLGAHSGSKGVVYSPTVEYRTPDGGVHRIEDEGSSSHPGVELGDTVPVRYDPGRPEKGRMGTPLRLWGLGGFFVLLGLIFLVVGLVAA
jgi:hypothetical protein